MTGQRLPMFPLSAVLFPFASMPLHVFEPRYRALMRDCLAGDRRFGVVLIERGSEVGGGDQRASVGTRGVITRAAELADGRWVLQVTGESVLRVEQWLPDDPYPLAMVSEVLAGAVSEVDGAPAPEGSAGSTDLPELLALATARVRQARALLAEHGGAAPLPPESPLDGGGDPEVATWELCREAPLNSYDAQRLLAVHGIGARLALLARLMAELEHDLHRMLGSD